jgi:predicted nucleotidyltransferase
VEFDRAAIAAFCRSHHIRWLALFGSHARGEATTDSDVDIVVEFEAGRTPGFGIVTIVGMLTNLFGGRRVDLVTLKGVSPRIRERVLHSARVLYGTR